MGFLLLSLCTFTSSTFITVSETDSMIGCVFYSTIETSRSPLLMGSTRVCGLAYVITGYLLSLGLPRFLFTTSPVIAGVLLLALGRLGLWNSLMSDLTVERCLMGSQVLVSGGQFFHLTKYMLLPSSSTFESTIASTSQQESLSSRFINQKSIIQTNNHQLQPIVRAHQHLCLGLVIITV